MKIVRALLAVATLALVIAPLTSSRAAGLCPGVASQPPFIVIDRPSFPAGPPDLTGYAVDPYGPGLMFATNGQSVMVTYSSGCEWEPRFALDLLPTLDVPISAANSTIVDVDIPTSSYAHHNVYLTIAERVGPVTRPHVLVSRDEGNTWKLADNGLPPASGDILGLYVAPNHPENLYLHYLSPSGNDQLYASADGGANWEQRGSLTDDTIATQLAIDPQNPDELWLSGPGGLYHSTNGGRTRSHIDSVAPSTGMVDVWHSPGQDARIMAFEPETSSFGVSIDSGRTWVHMGGPVSGGNALSMSSTSAYDVVASFHEGVYQLQDSGSGPTWRFLGTPPRDVVHMTSDRAAHPSFYGRSNAEIVKYTPTGTVSLSPFDVNAADIAAGGPALMLPEKTKLKLRPHQTKKVPYTVDLPPLPNPLDVFFLVDTTQSMDASISGLRYGMQSIIDRLAAAGLDVQFGVGEIKDYPIPGYGDAQQGDFPYRLDRAIGPADATLSAALERLQASGGGAVDRPEAQLTGLFQAATGDGDPPWVPQGQDAGFRGPALKVIVNITDARFHDEPQHPSPPFETVVSALRDKGILQVGLAIYGPSGAAGMPDLKRMAAETDTTAPQSVDCDGNGSPDVPAGDPLVCEVADQDYDGSLNLAPAIIATLEAVTQEVPVEIVASGTPDLVADISPSVIPAVNLKEKNALDFDISFSCPQSLFGTTHDVKLEAKVAGTTEVTSTATVVCKPPPPQKKPKKTLQQILAQAAVTLPIAILAPPVPPPPVTQNLPGTQSAAQAQGAMATEQQEQLQLATAKQRARFQSAKEEEYKFSAYRDDRDLSPAPLYAAALLMSVAFGVASAVRRRAQVALAKRRR
jgi:hypothetical protein